MNAQRIDFRKFRREPALGWAILWLGAAVLSTVGWFDFQATRARDQREAARARQEQEQREAAAQARKPVVATSAQKRMKNMEAQLQMPWLPALRSLEDATDAPIYLLSLSVDPSAGRVRLEGEAPDFDAVLTYLQRIEQETTFDSTQLQSHEARKDGSTNAVRFAATTRWNGS